MKVLALGDFHGSFPIKLQKAIAKENPHLVLCTGDLPDTEAMRSIVFKHWDKLLAGASITDFVSKKRLKELQNHMIKSQEPLLRQLNKLGVPVVLIWGNSDYVDEKRAKNKIPFLNQRVKKYKNITFVSRERALQFDDIQILAFSGYRFPNQKGFYKVDRGAAYKNKLQHLETSWKSRLLRLFKKKDKMKTTIFLCHDPPRNHQDKVRDKHSPMKGKNLGDEHFESFLKRYQPHFCVCGHMHENPGKSSLGKKTVVVNTGPAFEGRYALIEKGKALVRKA